MKTGKSQPQRLSDTFRECLRKRELQSRRRSLTLAASEAVDFSSNDFLSLGRSELFRAKLLQHLANAPESASFASGGSRLLDGNSVYTQDLEGFIAGFHHAQSGLLFNSGYDANVGVLSTIPQVGDLIVFDEFVHASTRDGMRLSRAGRRVQFVHNSVENLRQVLENELKQDEELRTGHRNVFICIESLYSMDGDVAPIRSFIDTAKSLFPHDNAYFIVDEAHATGVFGHNGVGIVQDVGVGDDVFIRIHTFGKALASHGAIVICSPETRDYLVNYCRSLIYTTAMGYPLLAAIRTSYEILSQGLVEPLQKKLQTLISHLSNRLETSKIFKPPLAQVDHVSGSPILSIRSPYPRELAAACQAKGYTVRAIMSPTVPLGKERIRICLHAGNTAREIDGLIDTLSTSLTSLAQRSTPKL